MPLKKIFHFNFYFYTDMPGSGGVPLAGPLGLSHLKASLKDPGFIKKIRDLEDRRQVTERDWVTRWIEFWLACMDRSRPK